MPQDGSFVASGSFGTYHLETPSDLQSYMKLYNDSVRNREEFWAAQAKRLRWDEDFTRIVHEDFTTAEVSWFGDGIFNACRNALDVHIEHDAGDNPALAWYDGDGVSRTYSYLELRDEVVRVAGMLKAKGYNSGDRVALYLPDRPETVIMMLACARLGIIYVPIPARFTAEIAVEIVGDCGASLVLMDLDSADSSYNARARSVISLLHDQSSALVLGGSFKGAMSWDDLMNGDIENADSYTRVKAEHTAFIIYANSAAGVPRGSVFATGGFMVQAASSFDFMFRQENGTCAKSILCTLDLASAAGQTYGLWGTLLNGDTLIISAAGDQAGSGLLGSVLEQFPASAFVTSPSMLASLRSELPDSGLQNGRTFTLVVCSGDVLSPRLVTFAGNALTAGSERVLNMWIQSESGTSLISTLPQRPLNRPGALGLPQLGVSPKVLNTMGQPCRANESGQLVFDGSWPAMVRGIWGQKERYRELYFQRVPGYFNTNDGVRIDNEGFIWFMGRIDDVIKVRGQSLATSEIEAVLVAHPDVNQVAVVSITGEESGRLFAFVAVDREKTNDFSNTVLSALEADLVEVVSRRIGEFAVPNRFVYGDELPRTRTGKVVRRVLRRIATGDISSEEDLSHVANPQSVQELIKKRGS